MGDVAAVYLIPDVVAIYRVTVNLGDDVDGGAALAEQVGGWMIEAGAGADTEQGAGRFGRSGTGEGGRIGTGIGTRLGFGFGRAGIGHDVEVRLAPVEVVVYGEGHVA